MNVANSIAPWVGQVTWAPLQAALATVWTSWVGEVGLQDSCCTKTERCSQLRCSWEQEGGGRQERCLGHPQFTFWL